jgi:hypothetical protein
MSIVILHLSDLHIKGKDDHVLHRSDRIAATIFNRLPTAEAIFILISGDIACTGAEHEYVASSLLINGIISVLNKETNIPVYVVMVPGNHDCDFSKPSSIRDTLIGEIVSNGENVIDDEKIEACVKVQNNFINFKNQFATDAIAFNDQLWWQHKYSVGKYTVVVDCLNVSWMSQLKEKQGHLVYPVDRYQKLQSVQSDLRFVILHHPLNWYTNSVYNQFRTLVYTIGDVIISGHEHIQTGCEIDNLKTSSCVCIEGGALQGHSRNEASSFNVIEIDLDEKQYLVELFTWSGTLYEPQDVNSAWSSYRKLAVKRRGDFNVQPDFLSMLQNPGANFSHPGKTNLSLVDIYLFPDFQIIEKDKKTKNFINSKILLDPENINGGVLLRGDDKSGKTSLLFMLYRRYQELGLVPIYLPGSLLTKTSEKELSSFIENEIANQYGSKAIEPFRQLTKVNKVLLLDDFDRIRVSEKFRGKALQFLAQCFPNMIVTTNSLFELKEVLSPETAETFKSFKHYEMRPFGYELRYDLIHRWFNLGSAYETSEIEISKKIDHAEKLINTVLGKNLIPSVPFYLLTLLQSFEAGHQSEIQNSAYGYYYQYLITQAIQRISIKPEKWDEFFNYLAQLAWEFKKLESRELDIESLRLFNDNYSHKFFSIDLALRLEQLCDSKILSKRGNNYSFSYPYIYYFFLGKFLAANFSDTEIRKQVEHYCDHLYVKEYANAVLFLTHFSKEPLVIDRIAGVLRGLFSQVKPMRFEEDTKDINELIDNTTKLVFKEGDVEDNRREEHRMRDELERKNAHKDAESEDRERIGEPDLFAKLNLLFKTVDILGQILRNYYGSMPNCQKEQLLTEIFEGPLRALNDFIEYVKKDKEALICEVEGWVEKNSKKKMTKEQRSKVARNAVFNIVGLVNFVFIYKTSVAIASEDLYSVINQVVKANPNLAYRLIELGVQLEFPGAMPIEDIRKLESETNSNMVARRLLETFIMRHLYMFKTDIKDKQRISELFRMETCDQHKIDIKSKKMKRLQ